jgi:hypothetical protein
LTINGVQADPRTRAETAAINTFTRCFTFDDDDSM